MENHDRREPAEQDTFLRAREAELMRSAREDAAEEPLAGDAGATTTATEVVDLHVCGECGSELVYPIDWTPAAPRQWMVRLRCPDCEHESEGIHDQATVDRFDEILDDGSQAILDDLTKLTHANMADDIERFVDALEQELILPEDF